MVPELKIRLLDGVSTAPESIVRVLPESIYKNDIVHVLTPSHVPPNSSHDGPSERMHEKMLTGFPIGEGSKLVAPHLTLMVPEL